MIRATYLLSGSFASACFCIRDCQGHPQNAATYLWKMHTLNDPSNHYAEKFIRANTLATFAYGHEEHRHTHYRYTLNSQGLLRIQHRPESQSQWRTVYTGLWWEFVNLYMPSKKKLFSFAKEQALAPFLMTLSEAHAYVERGLRSAENVQKEGLPYFANLETQRALAVKQRIETIVQSQKKMAQQESKLLNALSLLTAAAKR